MSQSSAQTRAQGNSILAQALATEPDLIWVGETKARPGLEVGQVADSESPRVLTLPIADRGMMAFALGLVMGGKRAVVELSSTSRIPAVLDILQDAGALSVGGEFRAPLVLRVPYGDSSEPGIDRQVGLTLSALAGIQVVCPSNRADSALLLELALKQDRPVIFLEPYSLPKSLPTPLSSDLKLGCARVRQEGSDITLAAWGPAVSTALQAAAELALEDISVGVIDLVSLHPIDRGMLGAVTRETGRLLLVHPFDEALANHILYSHLSESFTYLESPLESVCNQLNAITTAARRSIYY